MSGTPSDRTPPISNSSPPTLGVLPPADPPEPPSTNAPIPRPSRRFETLVTVGILLGLLMGALDQFVALTALPTILSQFHAATDGGTFVISAYVIASTTAIPVFAKLSDIWSRRNVFLGGLAIFIVGSILSGLSQNLSELIVFRAIQGFGSGGFFPVGIAIVAVTFPPETRARITGALSGVFGIAVVAGPLLGSSILNFTHNDWRWLFYVNIPVGVAGFAIIATTLGPLLPEKVRKFDVVGAALLAGWVAALMLPLYLIADSGWSWTDPRVLGLLIAAVVLLVVFVLWELRVENPLVPLRLFAARVMAAGGGATFFVGLTFFPLATFVSLVVGEVLAPAGSDVPNIVRDMLYALVIPLVVGAALGGQLLTKFSYRVVAVAGILISIVGMVGLSGLSSSTPLWDFAFGFVPVGGVVLPLIPLGFGIGLTFPVFLLAAQNQVSKDDVGEAGGLIQFLQSLGGAIGLSMLASFQATRFQSLAPAVPSLASTETAIITSYDQTFEVMLGLLVVALLFAVFLKGRLPRGPSPTPTPSP
jgi:EmrB/QacA subfamily drug resistance transporter